MLNSGNLDVSITSSFAVFTPVARSSERSPCGVEAVCSILLSLVALYLVSLRPGLEQTLYLFDMNHTDRKLPHM